MGAEDEGSAAGGARQGHLRAGQLLGVAAGDLRVGGNADICMFDPEQYWKVERRR